MCGGEQIKSPGLDALSFGCLFAIQVANVCVCVYIYMMFAQKYFTDGVHDKNFLDEGSRALGGKARLL